jgi:hypothetical protein
MRRCCRTRLTVTGSVAVTSSATGSRYVRPISDAELTKSTIGASATQAPTWRMWRRVSRRPACGSLIATTSATAERSVLPSAPQRGSSTSSSRKKFASSRTSRLA